MLDWAPIRSFLDLMNAGGPLIAWIFLTCVVMWTLIFERLWFYKMTLPRMADHMLGTWHGRAECTSWSAHQIRKAMISRLNAEMNANMPMLKVLVPLSPLLGLVGTVTGMLAVFDSMAALGSADARSMASGVSEAMNCTMTGLAVSVTGMYPVFYLQARSRRMTELLADRFKY